MKKIFENAVWWSGVIMVGLVLGISLQFVKAWTEPTTEPPNGNVGAPINTEANLQTKSGSLALLGQLITSYINIPGSSPVAGSVLTAQNASGQVAWEAGGGGGACYIDYSLPTGVAVGTACKASGFTVKNSAGIWGYCVTSGPSCCGGQTPYFFWRPPGGGCPAGEWRSGDSGEAFVCCQ